MTEAGLIDSVAPEVRVQTFLKGVAEAKMSALLLDFDGTLAPFRIDPAQVRPWAGMSALLDKIQAVGRTRVVIVSGRSTQEIAAQLGVATMPEIWGLHGAERRWPDGGRATDHMTPEQRETLAMARAALAESDLIGQLGLRLEDKRNAVVVHWRGSQASVVREAMARVGAALRPFAVGEQMKLLSFDGGIELRCGGDKGDAVRALLKEMDADAPVAYLGDDVTDEDAFNALKDRGMSGLSLSVLVRRTARPSAASVWLRPPVQLRLFLKDWLAAISNDGAGMTGQAMTQPESQADSTRTLAFILQGWKPLTRSTNECHSFEDVKVVADPVLYLPAGMEIPADVAHLHDSCGVEIRTLPRLIKRMGDVTPEDLSSPGLLYLPNAYVVPGGRFNEMYGWDSYYIVLGLLESDDYAMARGMVDNFIFEIEHYGAVLNANRSYYLTRSQPPVFSAMIRAVFEDGRCFLSSAEILAWLHTAYDAADDYYASWSEPYRAAGETGLTRYYDLDCGPVPEMADDHRYFHEVIEWLLKHRDEDPGYLVAAGEAAKAAAGLADDAQSERSARTGVAHERASVDGYELTEDFYLGDRAMRESGYDSSFRFGPFCGSTHHFAATCLNSILYRYERDMAHFATLLAGRGESDEWRRKAAQWEERAARRGEAVRQHLWDEDEGMFMDYDFVHGRLSSYQYLSAFFPMWAGLATKEEAVRLHAKLPLFEREGGLMMSTERSGMQWDAPYGWAPANWMAVSGLYNYGFREDAVRIAKAFMRTIDANYARDETVREKYDVVECGIDVHVTAGYKDNVIGFGWTNGVYLKMRELIAAYDMSAK